MKKEVIVLNCGSSSVKFAIIDADTGEAGLSGIALGNSDASLSYKLNGKKEKRALPEKAGHTEALSAISEVIASTGVKPIAIGHRVVHGGEKFKQAALVDDSVLKAIEDYASMAPLHNMANLKGIVTAQEAYPDLPHVLILLSFKPYPKKPLFMLYPCRFIASTA